MSFKAILYSAPPKITTRVIAAIIAILLTLVSVRITTSLVIDEDGDGDEAETEEETEIKEDFDRTELDSENATSVGTVVNGSSAILVDLTNKTVIAEKNKIGKTEVSDASVFMVALTVSSAINGGRVALTDEAVCPASAAKLKDYSVSEDVLPIGKRMKIGDILKCMFYQRGPSYAYTLAVHISGSEEAFVTEMNGLADSLKLNDTAFNSIRGGTVSAYDLAVIIKRVLEDPLLKSMLCSDDMLTVGYGQSGSVELVVKNEFFDKYCTESQAKSDGIIGGKVGENTSKGWSAIIFSRGGKIYLALILDSGDAFADALMLYTAYVLSVEGQG